MNIHTLKYPHSKYHQSIVLPCTPLCLQWLTNSASSQYPINRYIQTRVPRSLRSRHEGIVLTSSKLPCLTNSLNKDLFPMGRTAYIYCTPFMQIDKIKRRRCPAEYRGLAPSALVMVPGSAMHVAVPITVYSFHGSMLW